MILRVLPRLTPFERERYLGRHFDKTRAQTLMMLRDWSTPAEEHGMPAVALDQLQAALAVARR